MSSGQNEIYEFGQFRLEPLEGVLSQGGEPILLTPKVFETLLILVRNAGRLLTREELMLALWPDRTVGEANLSQNIWTLRRALGDRSDGGNYIETVPRRGFRFVAPVTRVGEPEMALPISSSVSPTALAAEAGFKLAAVRRSRAIAVGLAVGLPLCAVLAFLLLGRLNGQVRPRRSVAVFDLKNLSGRPDSAWLSTALSEMLGTELATGERLRVISGASVARMKAELNLAPDSALAESLLSRVRANLGTDLIVLGSFTHLGTESGRRLRLDLRVYDAKHGETVGAFSEAGAEGELFDLVTRVGSRLRAALGVPPLSPAEASGVKGALPSNPEAARLYAGGLEALHAFDARTAREQLEKAAALAPEAPLVHSALSAAWSALGYDQRSKAEARRAFELSENLPREERLQIEGIHREANREWEKAIEVYGALFGFFPDSLEYGLKLAGVEAHAGRGREALKTLGKLRRLPALQGDDPRIDVAEAVADESLADHRAEREAAARAVTKGEARQAWSLVAQARLLEAEALQRLGDGAGAARSAAAARESFEKFGDHRGVGQALQQTALVTMYAGDFARAGKLVEESVSLFRALGSVGDLARALSLRAIIDRKRGDLDGAMETCGQALNLSREVGDRREEGGILTNLAIISRRQGKLDASDRFHSEALEIYAALDEREGIGVQLNGLGHVRALQGRLEEARADFGEALRMQEEMGNPVLVASVKENLATLQLQMGSLAAARKNVDEGLVTARRTGPPDVVGYGLTVKGDILLQQGDLAAARRS